MTVFLTILLVLAMLGTLTVLGFGVASLLRGGVRRIAHHRTPGRASRTRDRRDEREFAAARLVHSARRDGGCRLPPSRAYDRAASRAPGQRASRRRTGQPRSAQIPQPPLGPPLRARPPGQRQRPPPPALA